MASAADDAARCDEDRRKALLALCERAAAVVDDLPASLDYGSVVQYRQALRYAGRLVSFSRACWHLVISSSSCRITSSSPSHKSARADTDLGGAGGDLTITGGQGAANSALDLHDRLRSLF